MKNEKIQQAGFHAVKLYEDKRKWAAKLHQKDGFDIISRRNGQVRHIEVKATTKKYVPFRWLENEEYKKLNKDKKYFLYLVTDVFGTPHVFPFSRTQALNHYHESQIKHIFRFKKKDFET